MGLNSALSIATGGLAAVQSQITIVSQNVANAGTAGYAREVAATTSISLGGQPGGVALAPTTRVVDTALEASLYQQNATVAGLTTQQSVLATVDAALGSSGSDGSGLSTLVGNLTDAFTTLQQDPSSAAQQQAVVSSAQSLASGVNALSAAYTTARQGAQDSIVATVPQVNAAVQQIGALSSQIIKAQSQGTSTADLENQRDAQMTTLSSLLDVRFAEQPNGDMAVTTASGLALPTHNTTGPLATSGATLSATSAYPGSIPGITIDGQDVTAQLTGGSLGANITLRDNTLPTEQAELDEYANTLSTRFDAQGLRLFSDGNGNLPSTGGAPVQSGYVGYAATIQVDPAVLANPSAVRDGTQSVAGSPAGASAFTPNPSGGPASFGTLISRVLSYGLGADAQAGVAQSGENSSGLGPSGTLNATYASSGSLVDLASALGAAQSQTSTQASTALTSEQSVQTALQSRVAAVSGVSVDTELSNMVALQNAYGANAKIISAVQSMFTTLLNAVTV